jgi:hypothetical protein
MSVHIGEVHTDVVSGGGPGPGTAGGGTADELEERLAELCRRAADRERRLAAEGFDD